VMSSTANRRALILLTVLLCSSSLGVAAQDSEHSTDLQPRQAARDVVSPRARHLDSWLEYMSRARRGSRINRAVWKMIGAGVFGLSTGLTLAEGAYEEDRGSSLSVPLSSGIAVALLADGIVALSLRSNEELRYQRWRSLASKDESAIARFEGELAASAAESRRSAMYEGALSIGVAAAGAALLVVTPFRNIETSTEVAAYAAGTLVLGIGLWNALTSFLGESWGEEMYRAYTQGGSPERAGRLRFAPSLAANGGGFNLSGTF